MRAAHSWQLLGVLLLLLMIAGCGGASREDAEQFAQKYADENAAGDGDLTATCVEGERERMFKCDVEDEVGPVGRVTLRASEDGESFAIVKDDLDNAFDYNQDSNGGF